MANIKLTYEQKLNLGTANRILSLFETLLKKENMEFIIEGETMLFRTRDEQNIFKLVDSDMEDNGLGRDGVILLPRTTDAQKLFPIKLDGKDLE